MERADLSHINDLYEELILQERAVAFIEAGGIITSFSISSADPNQPPPFGEPGPMVSSVTIPATSIPHPPQMLQAIKAAVLERIGALKRELTELGVTL